MARLTLRYRLSFEGGSATTADLHFDAETMVLEPPSRHGLPSWTALSFERCPNCPLRSQPHAVCPLAASLTDVIDACRSALSHETVRLEFVAPERTTIVNTTAQRAIGSLMGLLMPCSGCPRTAFLRPMARFHLPCASELETIFRASGMYLLAQYFFQQQGDAADWSLSGLTQLYRELHEVNKAMARRLQVAVALDASINAVVLLDLFAKALPYAIDESLAELRPLFEAHCARPGRTSEPQSLPS